MKCVKCGADLVASVLVVDLGIPPLSAYRSLGPAPNALCQHEPDGGPLFALSMQQLSELLMWAFLAELRPQESMSDYLEAEMVLHQWGRNPALAQMLRAWVRALGCVPAATEAASASEGEEG